MDEFQIRAVGRSEILGLGQALINGHLIEHLLFLQKTVKRGLTPVPTALQIVIESLETRFPTYYSSLPSLSRAVGRSENQGENSNLVGIICTRVGIWSSDLQKMGGKCVRRACSLPLSSYQKTKFNIGASIIQQKVIDISL